jgi:uncharacterized protein YacL
MPGPGAGKKRDASRLDRRKFGFWHILLEQNKWRLVKWEGVWALVIGVGGGIEVTRWTTTAARVSISGDFLTIVSALLGVVLASFALVVAFLSESYTLQLQKNPKGVRAFFAPFVINVGVDVGLIIGTVAYRAIASNLPHLAEKILFVILASLFIYAILNIMALTRAVMAHAVTRAELIEMDDLEAKLNSDRKP